MSVAMMRWHMWRACSEVIGRLTTGIVAAAQELIFLIGVLVLGTGCWWISPAAALIVVGSLLVWVAIPTRHFPVVFRAPKEPK